MSFGHRARFGALVAGGLLVLTIAAPGLVAADTTGGIVDPAFQHNATVQVVDVALQAKGLARVTLDVSCQPFQELYWDGTPTGNTLTSGSLGGIVELRQVQGKAMATGTGSLNTLVGGSPITCDGSTVRVSAAVLADGLPFKKGTAIVGAYVGFDPAAPCCGNWTFDQAASGWLVSRIR